MPTAASCARRSHSVRAELGHPSRRLRGDVCGSILCSIKRADADIVNVKPAITEIGCPIRQYVAPR